MKPIGKILPALVLAAALLPRPDIAFSGANPRSPKGNIAVAVEFLNQFDFNAAINLLRPMVDMKLNPSDFAYVNYLMGLAIFKKTSQEIGEFRLDGNQKVGELLEYQIRLLKDALDYFRVAYDFDPEGKIAPDSLYMAGQLLDFGCLQRFREALSEYQQAFELYPNTEAGRKARQRYNQLRSILSPQSSQNFQSGTN